jgi:hypothetical protein
LTKLTTALVAPMARARVTIAITLNPGLFNKPRSATLTPFNIPVIRNEARSLDQRSARGGRERNRPVTLLRLAVAKLK